MRTATGLTAICLSALASAALAQDQPPQAPPSPQQRVAMLKQWLAASQAQMRTYEWIETTVISKDGEEKHRTEKRCYYGVDGALQKVAVSDTSTGKSGGPPGLLLPGKLIKKAGEHKAEELEEYMKSAAELIQQYVPPDPQRIQQSVNAGQMSMNMIQPGRMDQLQFGDYLKSGDSLSVDIEVPTNRLAGLHVASYVDKPEDAVRLDVTMSVLPDGTIYAQRSTLNAESKGVTVVIENTGYHKP